MGWALGGVISVFLIGEGTPLAVAGKDRSKVTFRSAQIALVAVSGL